MQDNHHIELNRKFIELPKNAEDEARALALSFEASIAGGFNELDWTAILRRPRVVVLGEPGSGKTAEFRHQSDQLSTGGSTAFIIDLRDLVGHRLSDILNRKRQLDQFRAWRTGNQPAWFFLDAVDESKLLHVNDFRTALENFARDLDEEDRARSHVLLSSRNAKWQLMDLLLFESLLPIKEGGNGDALTVEEPTTPLEEVGEDSSGRVEQHQSAPEAGRRTLVVEIAPLSLDQIEAFVDARGEDGRKFREDLVANFVEPLSRRPLDVEYLIQYWRDKGGFGSYLEVIEYSVDHGLREPGSAATRAALTPQKARSGAETLAAMVILCRRRDIGLRASTDSHLRPRLALPEDMTDGEIESLLDRAIFDVPFLECVRFHHREIEDYLTASWYRRLVEKNLPLYIVKRQLFEEVAGGQLVLRQAMAPVAAWFSCLDVEEAKQIRAWVRVAEPELFFRAGDPGRLTRDFRKSIFDAVISSYEGWDYTRIDVTPAALLRLADQELAPYLAEKCLDRSIADDLRSTFFYMTSMGHVSGLEESAMEVILDKDSSDYIKQDACDYLAAIGNVKYLDALAASLAAIPALNESLVASLMIALFPRYLQRQDAIQLVARLNGIEEFSSNLQFSIARHCREKSDADDVVSFIDVFSEVLTFGPPWYRDGKDEYRVGSDFVGLGDVLLELLPEALKKPDLTTEQISILAKSVWLVVYLSTFGKVNRLNKEDLRGLLSSHEAVRRQFLLFSLNTYLEAHGDLGTGRWFFTENICIPVLQDQDASWVLDEANHVSDSAAELLLWLVQSLWTNAGHPGEVRRKAMRILRQRSLAEHGRRPAFPGMWVRSYCAWLGKYRRTIGHKYWWSRRARILKSGLRWWQNEWQLLKLLPRISSGSHKSALWFLMNELSERDSSHLARTGWRELQKRRGRVIERAARKGVVAFWQKFDPQLPHERPNGDRSIDVGVIIGLTGIQEALSTTQLDFKAIDDTQARRLARYALLEINGFPAWFKDLAIARPDSARSIVESAVEDEWQLPSTIEHIHGVLAALSYDQTGVYLSLFDPVLDKLGASDPQHPEVLSQALRLLYRDLPSTADSLKTLAATRVSHYPAESVQHIIWMSTLLQFDAEAALDYLDSTVAGVGDPKGYLVRLAATLSPDGRSGKVDNPSYRAAGNLHRLILRLFEFLRPEEDPDHSDGKAYTVTSLDHASRFRDSLIPQLSAIPEQNAEKMLESLLDESILKSRHDWIRHLLLQRRRDLGTQEPWTESRVRDFEARYEVDPRNCRELFQLVCDRLTDIKNWVETGEDSPRSDLHSDSIEKDVRVWLGRKLRERSRGRYVVPEEHELASSHRQDIRIEAPEVPGPIIIEVKQVEGWSYTKLRERLENQLIGDYLKAPNARFGVFLVSYTGHKGVGSGSIDKDKNSPLTLAAMIQNLQSLANSLVKDVDDLEQVIVTSIDFVTI